MIGPEGLMSTPHIGLVEQIYMQTAGEIAIINNMLLIRADDKLALYVPNVLSNDLFYGYDRELGILALFLSTGRKKNVPTWGSDSKFFSRIGITEAETLLEGQICIDISGSSLAKSVFESAGFDPGPAVVSKFPFGWGKFEEQRKYAELIADIILSWADRERRAMENSKIFLSHRGVNKPLVQRIDYALTMLNLKPWLDKHDLPVGDPLVRGVDDAFTNCAAAVFFISAEFVDEGVIGQEISRAIHENALRPSGFRIIPLVLTQHGGEDSLVPNPLRTLKWERVADIDIVPTILRSLPAAVQAFVRFAQVRG